MSIEEPIMKHARGIGIVALSIQMAALGHAQEAPRAHTNSELPHEHSDTATLEQRIALQDRLIAALRDRIRELEAQLVAASSHE